MSSGVMSTLYDLQCMMYGDEDDDDDDDGCGGGVISILFLLSIFHKQQVHSPPIFVRSFRVHEWHGRTRRC